MRPARGAATIAHAMTTTAPHAPAGYALGREPAEYRRLRTQARALEPATARLLDHLGLAPGARCLDAGCGAGDTMRLMAQRVGPTGAVLGVDLDARLGADALAALHAAGHHQCAFTPLDLTIADEIPGGPFDLVFARLLLMHLPDPVRVLRTLWSAVAAGGHLLVQEYDLRAVGVLPELESMAEFRRVMLAVQPHADLGQRLPLLFAQAGIGTPDGTDVTGRLEPLRTAGPEIAAVWTSALPAAVAHGLVSRADGERWAGAFGRDVTEHPDHTWQWPPLMGA